MYLTHVRDITVSGFSAEPDPRASAPAANKLFAMGKIDNPKGHAISLRFIDNAGADVAVATSDFTAWFKDENSGAWFSITPETAAESGRLFMAAVAGGSMYVQVTAMSPSTAVTLQIWACELSFAPVT